MSSRLRQLASLALLSAFLALPACGTVSSWLPKVLSVLTESATILDAIDSRAADHFDESPDPKAQKHYRRLMESARASLAAASATARGGEKVDAALTDFRKSYDEILALLGPLGVVAPSTDGAMSAGADGPLLVPLSSAFEP